MTGPASSAARRELGIDTDASGYMVLYRYDPMADTIYVLAVGSQRERDYKLR